MSKGQTSYKIFNQNAFSLSLRKSYGIKQKGKELDAETNFYYYGARYYDPRISTFLSVDPLAEQTGSSYDYTYNNPINFTDPTGMSVEGEPTDWYWKTENGKIIYKWFDGKEDRTNDGWKYLGASYNVEWEYTKSSKIGGNISLLEDGTFEYVEYNEDVSKGCLAHVKYAYSNSELFTNTEIETKQGSYLASIFRFKLVGLLGKSDGHGYSGGTGNSGPNQAENGEFDLLMGRKNGYASWIHNSSNAKEPRFNVYGRVIDSSTSHYRMLPNGDVYIGYYNKDTIIYNVPQSKLNNADSVINSKFTPWSNFGRGESELTPNIKHIPLN